MEYVHTTLAQIAANRVSEADALFRELEAHRDVASAMRGYQGMRVNRTSHPEGNVLVVVETRWSGNNDMVDYAAAKENAESIIGKYDSLLVPGSVQTHRMESLSGERAEAPNRTYDRLALALFVPVGVLAFAAHQHLLPVAHLSLSARGGGLHYGNHRRHADSGGLCVLRKQRLDTPVAVARRGPHRVRCPGHRRNRCGRVRRESQGGTRTGERRRRTHSRTGRSRRHTHGRQHLPGPRRHHSTRPGTRSR